MRHLPWRCRARVAGSELNSLRVVRGRTAEHAHKGKQVFGKVRYWHKADIPLTLVNVRFRGKADIAQTS